MLDRIDLNELEKKVMILLEEYKYPLIQVLRYRDEWRFVPEEIEVPVKYIIKNFQYIKDSEESTYVLEEFSFIKNADDVFSISTKKEENPLEVKIIQRDQPEKKHWGYRNIHYQWKTYEELALSGNTYNHIVSQDEKIRSRTKEDEAAWLLSPEEWQTIRIRSPFHDIPEYKKWDVICSSKTDEHSIDEEQIGEELIIKQDWLDKEKILMKEFSHLYDKNSLFKLYEVMFYVFDIHNMIQDKSKHNNSSYLAWATLGYQFPRFIKDYKLPNGKTIYWLDVPSCAKHLREHISIIDQSFAHVDETGVRDSRKIRYEEGKNARENIIKPYITKEK
jgi:hypothetical protein